MEGSLFIPAQRSKLEKVAPNSKKIIIPSEDKFFVNIDLSAGDLHFVAWMSNAKWVKECLRSGGDVYTELACAYYREKILKSNPIRQKFKGACHATNYRGLPKTIAMQTGLEEAAVKRIQEWYFNKNPEIFIYYQEPIIQDCIDKGYTLNPFGAMYQCPTTDFKVDKTWQQKMVALPAQGGVADYINEVMDRIEEGEASQPLPFLSKLQCHDAGLWEVYLEDETWLERFNFYFGDMFVPIHARDGTYDKLRIPWDISVGLKNYADCYDLEKLQNLPQTKAFKCLQ